MLEVSNIDTFYGKIQALWAFFEHAKPENVKAMIDFTKEYGVYK